MNALEFRACLEIDDDALRQWIAEGWIRPVPIDSDVAFREADIARGRLILDLIDLAGVNDPGIDIAINLIDQVHGLRRVLKELMTAIGEQDHAVQSRILRHLEGMSLQDGDPRGGR